MNDGDVRVLERFRQNMTLHEIAKLVAGKEDKTRLLVLTHLHEHKKNGELPTTGTIVFYELEQLGFAVKPDHEGPRAGKRRSIGLPPGRQDITDAIMWVRDEGLIPRDWIADPERSVLVWDFAQDVLTYLNAQLDFFRSNSWAPELPPMILTEAKSNVEVLRRTASEYCCPIAGLKGQSAGFLRTRLMPLLKENQRAVLYLGDHDRSGFDIERNTLKVLQDATKREIEWERIGLTEAQIKAKRIEPIWKFDGRDKKWAKAWECEALGQSGILQLVKKTLQTRLKSRSRDRLKKKRPD
jgi:hypothetical protein